VSASEIKAPTIAESWESFRAAMVPAGAGPGQVNDLRMAFYGGCVALHAINNAAAALPDAAALGVMEALDAELASFVLGGIRRHS
jgi:hypothetical protein